MKRIYFFVVALMISILWFQLQAQSVSYLKPVYNVGDSVQSGVSRWVVDTCHSYVVVTNDLDTLGSEDSTTWYVVDSYCLISKSQSVLTCIGDVHLILMDGDTLSTSGQAGIYVPDSSSLTIYAQSDDSLSMGKLYATGNWGAGIGGTFFAASGKITINGGKITARSTQYGAAIGGGAGSPVKSITINGGIINANGRGAGIGGGSIAYSPGYEADCTGENITINGGIITSTGLNGAGIGGGQDHDGKNIVVNDGIIVANGSAGIGGQRCDSVIINGGSITANGNPGIGGMKYGRGIAINGGTIEAKGGDYSAGIGGGYGGDADKIIINGGDITSVAGKYGSGIGGGCFGFGREITINGGEVFAYGGANGIGEGSSCSNDSTSVYVADSIGVRAGNSNPPSTVIPHSSSSTNLFSAIEGKCYVTTTVGYIETNLEISEENGYIAYSEEKTIVVKGVGNHSVALYDARGYLYDNIPTSSDMEYFNVDVSGIYFIVVDGCYSLKVLVK